MEIRTVGVVGLGTMGAGIAEVFARGGLAVTAVEADPQALARGMATIAGSFDRAVKRGRLTPAQADEIAGRVTEAGNLADLAGADLVVEVVPEQLAIKRQVLAELDRVCRPDTIFATNTSSLSVTTIAAGTARPGRVIGMHFFNPAPVMRLVEVVTTVLTDPAAAGSVRRLAASLGKTPVQVGDRAGFVANALLLPYLNHAVRLLETGYATREDIDRAMTLGAGLPMGPLTLLDLIGLDTSLAVLEVLAREFGGTRYTPAPLLRRLTDAGRLGRKSGAGFYEYPEGGRLPDEAGLAAGAPGAVTLLDPVAGADAASAERAAALAGLLAGAGIEVSRDPAAGAGLVVVAIGAIGGVLDAVAEAEAGDRSADAVGVRLVNAELAELVPSPLTSALAMQKARALAAKVGLRAVTSPDRPGLLVGALLYPHLRDAAAMVADGYAGPADVDSAMTLGCGYPRGPIRMLDEAGLAQAAAILSAMHAAYADPAFAPPPLLMACAQAGLALAPRG
jgi:3-hydroxybutyryl-CoA dehydrogenase